VKESQHGKLGIYRGGSLEPVAWVIRTVEDALGSANEVTVRLNAHEALVAALKDAAGGLQYIRERYGPLDGVGFDRVEKATATVLALVKGSP